MSNFQKNAKMITKIGITTVMLAFSIFLILGAYPEDYTKWAFGMIGLVVGYWFK